MSAETLLDIFVPPEGLVGHSAALVAMTGTEDFLEDAVQRFTGLRPRQRAELGKVLVYLMLDGHASSSRPEVFPPGRIPGLHEFQPRLVDAGSLLHAKIALLAFARSRIGAPVHLRLAVLTANFTYTSARQQLELVWVVDVPLNDTARPEDRADVRAAGAFVETLLTQRFHRDEQSLRPEDRKLTSRLDVLLTVASSLETEYKPRFIHSLDSHLYGQIRERFSQPLSSQSQKRFRGAKAIPKPMNLLLCGSGFYEEPSSETRKPKVFGKLEEIASFTTNADRVALVEPDEAGAVAKWARNGDTDGWKIVRPCDARDHNRRLHAKFVYAGYRRNGRLSNGWLYLGSGNLSRRGLLSDGMTKGNVESGVVFEVADFSPEDFKCRLFWAQDHAEAIDEDEWAVSQVGDAPVEQSILEAPPILSAIIETTPARRLRLLWREDATGARIAWTKDDGTKRDWSDVKPANEVKLNDDENPTVLSVRNESDREWTVPVVDVSGRVGWKPPKFDTYADALAALLDFPIRPAEATDDDDDDEGDKRNTKDKGAGETAGETNKQKKNYALHAAAEIIEKVAALQSALPETMLDDWLDHLDRMFSSTFPQELIETLRTHRLNIFEHLMAKKLQPPNLKGEQQAKYCKVLDGAARAWGFS